MLIKTVIPLLPPNFYHGKKRLQNELTQGFILLGGTV